MSRRFFSDSPITSEHVQLTGPEAQHLAKVMRAKAGDEVVLFDGTGSEFSATVTEVGRSEVALRVTEQCQVDRELSFELTLAVALPKGERQRWLVEKLTELGCTRLQPLLTARGVAQPTGNALARLRRTVIEASKQCGRNRLMEIAKPMQVTAFLRHGQRFETRLIAHPALKDATPIQAGSRQLQAAVVGPEGGFTSEEVMLANNEDWTGVSLGPRILRTETAAVAVVTLLTYVQR